MTTCIAMHTINYLPIKQRCCIAKTCIFGWPNNYIFQLKFVVDLLEVLLWPPCAMLLWRATNQTVHCPNRCPNCPATTMPTRLLSTRCCCSGECRRCCCCCQHAANETWHRCTEYEPQMHPSILVFPHQKALETPTVWKTTLKKNTVSVDDCTQSRSIQWMVKQCCRSPWVVLASHKTVADCKKIVPAKKIETTSSRRNWPWFSSLLLDFVTCGNEIRPNTGSLK